MMFRVICLYAVTLLFGLSQALEAQQSKQIEIVSSQTLSFDKRSGIEAQKLIGDVCFKQGDALMHCDSAYFYSAQNLIDAFGHIHIHQGDTLHLYGDLLKYDGNEKMAHIQHKVRLINKETTLTTEYLDYDISKSIAYYSYYGNIINGENKLVSRTGYYYAHEKVFYFRGSVRIDNPKYTITSDTLKYNTVSRTAFFMGPTDILAQSNTIYCENGWYNTQTNISQFNKNAYLKSEKRLLKGDSLYYDRNNAIGKAFNNIRLIDSTHNIILCGNKAYYREKPEYAMITDNTLLMHVNEADTLFLHADTLQTKADSANKEKFIKAYHHVQFFRKDMQGRCDSLTYNTADSTMRMFDSPVLWYGESQITSDFVEMHMANQEISTVHFAGNSFVASQEDTGKFNQIKGKKMVGYFAKNELNKIVVSGNGQSIYYAKDKKKVIGANKSVCSNINIFLKDRRPSRIVFLEQPDATFIPIQKIKAEDINLKGFLWLQNIRPLTMPEIFIWK